jgi:23S rRNA (guanine2445-N2)-methyltransferase / 23S rRNA (guanine2069-N7)-methyltransferase
MALRLKDAVVDCFRQQTGERPNIDPKASDINLHVLIQPESITVSLDMSGESLHRRGYRRMIGEAPLKETLAAAILRQAGWPNNDFQALLTLCVAQVHF